MIAQLIIDDGIFLQTVPVKKSTGQESWELKIGCDMWVVVVISSFFHWLLMNIPHTHCSPTYALYFSITIIRVSVSGGTRLLGKVETSRGEILSLVEQKQRKDCNWACNLRLLCWWWCMIGSLLFEFWQGEWWWAIPEPQGWILSIIVYTTWCFPSNWCHGQPEWGKLLYWYNSY